jgi:Mce-associated membrane protein
VPPSRRRPIPTPPAGGRPKVAGLHRRAAESPADGPVDGPVADERVVDEVEDGADVVADEGVTEADGTELKAPEAVEWTPPATKQPKPAKPAKSAKAEKSSKSEPEEAEKSGEAQATSGSNRKWILPAALLLVAVLLGVLGTFYLVKSRSVSYDAALVDSATTSAVNGQVREAVEKSFSYNFADVESTEKAARELLTGKALCQYNAVFGPVKEVAPQQKLVVTVRVVSSAVSSLKDGHATVLVFADQVTTRTTDNQSGGGTAMLRVSAIDDGGRWKIDNMEMFGATADQTRQLQGC